MGFLLESLRSAAGLLTSLDPELLGIVKLSLAVSGSAVALAGLAGVPLACCLVFAEFPGRRLLRSVSDTLMSLPSVVAGLLVYSLLCRKGVFGAWDLLYSPFAMAAGQFVLALPIIVSLTAAFLEHADPRIRKTALTLGAARWTSALAVVRETRNGLAPALLAGFGRVFAEVGASMMLGGNIRNYTRNIPTAMAVKTSEGEFAAALALGIVLLLAAFSINAAVGLFRREAERAL
ncbi:MAG: ABC transporter permease [Elusimicrobia bacterium]|nr:ABC transporter permease [Elusimicrobiota bacterium]